MTDDQSNYVCNDDDLNSLTDYFNAALAGEESKSRLQQMWEQEIGIIKATRMAALNEMREQKGDQILEVFARFKHLDKIITDPIFTEDANKEGDMPRQILLALWQAIKEYVQATRKENGCPYWNPDVNIYPDEPENHCTCQFSKIRESGRKEVLDIINEENNARLKGLEIMFATPADKRAELAQDVYLKEAYFELTLVKHLIESLRTTPPAQEPSHGP